MANSFLLDSMGAMKKLADTKKAIAVDLAKTLETALTDARDEIIKRTQSGSDADGGKFPKYSDKYELFKRKKRGGPLQPDLTFTGSMLRSVQVKIEKLGVGLLGKIYFPANQQGKARGNQKLRNFFSLSKSQLAKINKAIQEAIHGRG